MANPKVIEFPLGDAYHLQYHYKHIVLSSAEILTSNSVPIEVIPTPGAGYMLNPILLLVKTNYGTITYATNTVMQLRWNAVTAALDTISLARTEDYIQMTNAIDLNAILANFENRNLTLSTNTGDPTAGDGTLDVYLWYINFEL